MSAKLIRDMLTLCFVGIDERYSRDVTALDTFRTDNMFRPNFYGGADPPEPYQLVHYEGCHALSLVAHLWRREEVMLYRRWGWGEGTNL